MGKSLRALHWAESKHPRDDRGRFARKGGGKWVERVGERAKASFGDVSLGYELGRGPAGRLQTGKGGLIDIGGLRKAAKTTKAAQAPSAGHSGGGKVNPQSLSVGDRFMRHGAEHEVIGDPVSGRRAGAAVTRVKVRRVADGKEGPLTLDGPVEKVDTTRVSGQSEGMKPTTTEIDTRRAGTDATGRDRGALARSAGGVMSKEAAGRHNTAAMKLQDQQKATPEQLAGVLRKHGLEAVAKDVDAGRYSKAATKLHDHTLNAMRNAPFEKRQEVRGVYNDLSRMPDDTGDAEDLDGMTVEKLGREWVVNDTSKDGKTVHMYGSTSKADAEDWARTAAASRLAMRAGDVSGSHAIHADRNAALGGGEGRIYRPQGSVAKVSAQTAAARKADLQAKIKAHRDAASSGGNADGGNFADDLRKEMSSQNDLAKATARGRTPAGAKLPTTRGGNINAKPARTDNRQLRTNSEVKTPQEAIADVGGDARVGRTASGEKVVTPKPKPTGEVRYEARQTERPKNPSRGDFGKGPFYDHTVVRIDKDGSEREIAQTNSASRAQAIAAEYGAKEADTAKVVTPNRTVDEINRVEAARANFGKGAASTKPDLGRRPDGTYKYTDYSKAGYDLGNLTVAEAGLPDKGAVHSQYQQMLRSINGLQRQGPARVKSKDQYYRPMTGKLEEAAQHVHEYGGNPDTVAKLRALADIFRPEGDRAPELRDRQSIKPVETRRYQTFADRMAGDMTDADRRAGHAESDRRRAELRAQEAEQARLYAEAQANDTRSEREKLTEQLRDARTLQDIGMRSGRLDAKREAAIKTAEARLAAMDTEDRHAKIKELGVAKGDTIKTSLGEFEVTGVTKEGTLRVVRPDGRRGGVDPKNVESVTKSAASQEKTAAARDRKIAALEKRVATLESSVSIASGRRKDSGARIQSTAETRANARLQEARFELHQLQQERAAQGGMLPKAEAGGRPGADAEKIGRFIGGRDELIRSDVEPEKDAHGKMLVPGDTVTIASRLHNREGEQARVLAVGIGKNGGSQLAEVRYANGDTEQVMTGNIVRSRPAGANYLDSLRAELSGNREAMKLRREMQGTSTLDVLGNISGEKPSDVAQLHREARRHRGELGTRLEQAANDLELLRRGNAGPDVLARVEKVDTKRVSVQASDMTANDKTPHTDELIRLRNQGREREQGIGPTPEVTGYVKGREVRPGMLINAADLLPMHERQGSTTGENPNPLGHAEWVRVGLVGNTNEKGFRQWGYGTLTGGMYVVLDTSGRPVGRMSANTIAEMSGSLDGAPAHMLDTVRMPAKVAKTVTKRGPNGEKIETTEMVDGFEAVHVPSKAAQEELGLPAPKMRSNGILDPADPHYGANATHPTPAHRPFGEPVKGSRTRAEAAADRAKRREVYASGETERAQRRAEEEARRKADAAVEREQERIEAERLAAVNRERYRRDTITRRHEQLRRDLAYANPEIYDRSINDVRPGTPEEYAAQRLTQGSSDLKWLASAYGLKTRGTTVQEQADAIVAAVKAGKTPDLDVGAPKVLGETEQAAAEAKKIATAEKRRRNQITDNFNALKAGAAADDVNPRTYWNGRPDPRAEGHYGDMSDTQRRQLAEAFGLENLTGGLLREAILEAIRSGRTPDLDAAPITSLKKSRR